MTATGSHLAQILNMLGTTVVSTLGASDVQVHDVVLVDPEDDTISVRDALVLLVGVRAGEDRTAQIVRALAQTGAQAVMLKAGTPDERLARCGIPVVLVNPAASWHDLLALLSAAVEPPEMSAGPLSRIESGDLFALANAVAAMAGGAVSIDNTERRVLAYSAHSDQPIDEVRQHLILDRQLPASYAWAYNRVYRATGVTRFEGEGYRSRLAIAVRAGDRVLGSIWVLEGDKAFSEEAERALTEAAPTAAMQLLRLRAVHDIDRRSRAETMRALLTGGEVEAARLSELRLPTDLPCDLIGFEVVRGPQAAMAVTQLLDIVTVCAESSDMRAASLTLGSTVYTIVPATDRGRLAQIAAPVQQRARQSLKTEVLAAAGPRAPRLADLHRARRGGDLALRVLQHDAAGRSFVTYNEVRTQALLIRVADVLHADPRLTTSPPLSRILEEDTSGSSGYARVLRAYLEAMGHVPTAARMLSFHENTIRYRLQRAEKLFGLDLHDPDERLLLWLQLRLLADDVSSLPAAAPRRPVPPT